MKVYSHIVYLASSSAIKEKLVTLMWTHTRQYKSSHTNFALDFKALLIISIKFETSALQNSFMMAISTMASKPMFSFPI